MNTNNIFQYKDIIPESIIINERNILNWLGYNGDGIEPFIIETIREYIYRTKNLIHPKGGIVIEPLLSMADGVIQLPDTDLNTGKIISGQLKHSEFIAIFIATIGYEVEQFSAQLFNNGDMFEGYVVNLIGSEAAESAAEYIHQVIVGQTAEDGYKTTNRFSPGYCNWDVAEQFRLFSQFPDSFNDVTLNSSALMAPVKSVSGIIGIGKEVKFRNYKCSLCADEKCIYRDRSLGRKVK